MRPRAPPPVPVREQTAVKDCLTSDLAAPARRREGVDGCKANIRAQKAGLPFALSQKGRRPERGKPCLPCHHRHPGIHDGMDRRRTAHEGRGVGPPCGRGLRSWPPHNNKNNATDVVEGDHAGSQAHSRAPQTGPGAVGWAGCRVCRRHVGPIPTWSNCFIRQALNREETKGDEGSLDVFPTVLMECGSWQVTALTAVGKLQHPTGHRILGMA